MARCCHKGKPLMKMHKIGRSAGSTWTEEDTERTQYMSKVYLNR